MDSHMKLEELVKYNPPPPPHIHKTGTTHTTPMHGPPNMSPTTSILPLVTQGHIYYIILLLPLPCSYLRSRHKIIRPWWPSVLSHQS